LLSAPVSAISSDGWLTLTAHASHRRLARSYFRECMGGGNSDQVAA